MPVQGEPRSPACALAALGQKPHQPSSLQLCWDHQGPFTGLTWDGVGAAPALPPSCGAEGGAARALLCQGCCWGSSAPLLRAPRRMRPPWHWGGGSPWSERVLGPPLFPLPEVMPRGASAAEQPYDPHFKLLQHLCEVTPGGDAELARPHRLSPPCAVTAPASGSAGRFAAGAVPGQGSPHGGF